MKRTNYFDIYVENIKKRKEEAKETIPKPQLFLHNCINDELIEFHDDHHQKDIVTTILKENRIKQIPSDILLDCMFYMDPKSLFCFIQTCRQVYGVFESIYCESVPRLRLDILNKKRDGNSMNRLIDLFSNQNCGKLEKVMMTYDQYFRVKSTSNWPLSYFHDHLKFKTVYRAGDPIIQDVNREADANLEILRKQEELKYSRQFPYGIFTQPDTYYITFDELVKRKCVIRTFNGELSHNIERVITPDLPKSSLEDMDFTIDEHLYIDRGKTSKYSEKIVRFFKHPYEMTLTDFENRFKNEVLNETERILIYDCCFEHNRTTNTRERFVVSGGSLLHTLVGSPFNDIDIFVINNGESMEVVNQAIKKVLLKFEEKSTGQKYNIMSSKSTINIFYDSCGKSSERKVQIVLLKYDSIEELLLFFDLDCCKIAHDGTRVWTVMECLRALKYKINIISNNRNETGNGEINHGRALKYGARGFFTFVIGQFHPLYHAMHCDFIMEQLRRSIIQQYAEIIVDTQNYRPLNPAVVYFVDSGPGSVGKEMIEEDDNLAYPKIFRLASYAFVASCIYNGCFATLQQHFSFRNMVRQHKSNEELEASISEKVKSDGYEFIKCPSDLFNILPENHNFLKEKYSDSYLVKKYCIVHCSKCNCYYYSLELAVQKDVNNHFSQDEAPKFSELNFDPRRHLLCSSCLKVISGDSKMKLTAFGKRNGSMEPLEKAILLKLFDFEKLEGLDEVSEDELYKSFHMYPRQTVKSALYSLLYKSNIELENGNVRISSLRPIMDGWHVFIPKKKVEEPKTRLTKHSIEDLIYFVIYNNPGISYQELSLLYDEESLVSVMTKLFEQDRVQYFGDYNDCYQAVSNSP